MVIEEKTKEVVEAQFKAIYTNKGEVKDLNGRNTELFNAMAETLGMKKSEIRLAFKQWEKQFEEDSDSFDNVIALLEVLGVGNEQ